LVATLPRTTRFTSAVPTSNQRTRGNYGREDIVRPGSGGRSWWAHFEFTRINIEPIILRKKFEERRILGAFCVVWRS